MSLEFRFAWENPEGARGAERRATWAYLEILVRGKPITRVIDNSSRGVRDGIYLPLAPVAQWFLANYWFVQYEFLTSSKAADEFHLRHNLRYGGEGFALPSLVFEPLGDVVKIAWSPVRLEAQRVEFTESGVHVLALREFQDAIIDLIEGVYKRLVEQNVEESFIQEEWKEISQLSSEEVDFCRIAASLGIDPFDLDEDIQGKILETAGSLPRSVVQDFFTTSSPTFLERDADILRTAISRSRQTTLPASRLPSIRRDLRSAGYPKVLPWEYGYSVARHVRQIMGLRNEPLTPHELSAEIGVGVTEHYVFADSVTDLFDAVMNNDENDHPGFVVARRARPRMEFSLYRAVFEYLVGNIGEPKLITSARSDSQKRNRAFAAELLLPADVLRGAVGDRIVSEEEVEDLGDRFGVSPYVVRHQLQNHNIARTVFPE
jgi:hypothetical protein